MRGYGKPGAGLQAADEVIGMSLLTLDFLGPAITTRPDSSISPETDMNTRCNHTKVVGVSGAYHCDGDGGAVDVC